MTIETDKSSPQQPEAPPPPPKRPLWRRFTFGLGRLLLWLVAIGFSFWAILAVYYANLSGGSPRTVLAILLALMLIASGIFIRPRKYARLAFVLIIVGVLIWYFSIQPRNDRDWLAEASRAPTFDINGDVITVHDIRNFDWRSDDDYTPRWDDRTYRLSDLRTVDFLLCRWGSK